MTKIAYEPHPVSPARKAELVKQGFKIVDERFRPAGAPKAPEPVKDEPKPEAVKPEPKDEAPKAPAAPKAAPSKSGFNKKVN